MLKRAAHQPEFGHFLPSDNNCLRYLPGFFEKVAPEDLPTLAGTTPKPDFLDSHEPRNHTGEKREGRGERGEEKRTAGTHDFYIAYFWR